ncbi:MAG: enoyl-CoA hydratase/isomerase family protein [Methylobacteriaceae bacterium]|nr:enoyl-CoA hydratase/isomerase family protein [Methylobacteriaceae bacterium]MBV9703281.1 enoyl-CoA hydratase/isomerase family protein [Methylobacteriaceae bacterium]
MTSHIEPRLDGAVLCLTMRRPEKKNALTGAMYEALIDALAEADRSEAIRAVVICGSGGSFTAGNDIGDFLVEPGEFATSASFRFVKAIASCDTPLIAAVEGAAVGIGTTMLFHCDLAYAAPGASFRMPFVDLGVVPEAASSLLAVRRFGMAKAAEFLMLGEAFDAREALRLGLINAVLPADQVLDHAMAQAHRLASKPAAAIAATRRLMRGDRAEILAHIDEEASAFAQALTSPEAQAIFKAFLAKSKSPKSA